jgi:histidine triad (HIT) family protein
MASIFSRIIAGEIPCHKVGETKTAIAFMDIAPLAMGHVLVVPKTEVDRYFDLSDGELSELNVFAKKVAVAIEAVVPCKRVGVAVIGLEVPHAHIHLIPLNSVEDINFERAKMEVGAEELAGVAEKIRRAYELLT